MNVLFFAAIMLQAAGLCVFTVYMAVASVVVTENLLFISTLCYLHCL